MSRRLFWILVILISLGLAVLSSAGLIDAQKKFGSSYYYFTHQLLYGILPGVIIAFLLSKIDYHLWRKLSLLILFGSLVLMTLVFVPGFGYGAKGAIRWLNIQGFIFQPAEILKLALVIYLAAWFGGRSDRVKNWSYGLLPFFILVGFVGLLLALQPDIGTLIIVALIALGIYFVAGVNIKYLLGIALVGIILFSVLVAIEPYRLNRFKAYLNPDSDPRGIAYQVNQSLIAIGSGGLFGVGYGHSSQKFGFLPEVIGDSIFAVLAEELGFLGASVTVLLYGALGFTLIQIARNTKDRFGMLFTMGIAIWVVGQAFVNIMAISGLAPLTGIPLPFISYGSTSTIALLSGLGIVFNIAKGK
ncbi:MAG TPA: putative lipid II flippase FtsW [Candidatus Paceibacterota bacterium]